MPLISYTPRRFSPASREMIDRANVIIQEYAAMGFDLTLRQLFYQFVARDLLANNVENYKRLGSVVNDARLAGMIDWDRLVDRTRGIEILNTWDSPSRIIRACADQFRFDLWEGQTYRPEVWIEKEALQGVFEGVCNELRVPYLSCRGYTSQSEMWRAGRRFAQIRRNGQIPVIIHFGDHDPSGIDMTRDIGERMSLFVGRGVEVRRLALNMDQVEQYNPPPNPAKTTDARFADYEKIYGAESWELDALEPAVLAGMVRTEVESLRDQEAWDEAAEREEQARLLLGRVSDNWDQITEGLQ